MDAITSVPELRRLLENVHKAWDDVQTIGGAGPVSRWAQATDALNAALNTATIDALLTAAESGHELLTLEDEHSVYSLDAAAVMDKMHKADAPLFPEAAMRRPSTPEEGTE